ncbi:TLC domain [Popillia japonica]|uniref:TLC domain n=1 Tax=Popillia japonica TaxID=7064 RepID=A0AAW1L9M2_POPJA
MSVKLTQLSECDLVVRQNLLSVYVNFSATFWVCYYFLMRHLLKDRSPEFCNRIITLVHGASVAILGVNQCFTGEVSPIYRPQNQSTTLQKFIIVWSLGYFLFDLGWCSYYQSETVLMITHHICSVVALWRMLMKDTSASLVCTNFRLPQDALI